MKNLNKQITAALNSMRTETAADAGDAGKALALMKKVFGPHFNTEDHSDPKYGIDQTVSWILTQWGGDARLNLQDDLLSLSVYLEPKGSEESIDFSCTGTSYEDFVRKFQVAVKGITRELAMEEAALKGKQEFVAALAKAK